MDFQEIVNFFSYSGIGVILFLIFLLVRDSKKQESKKVLACILFSFLIIFLTYTSFYSGKNTLAKSLLFPIGLIIPFILGPLFYYYIKLVYEYGLHLDKTFCIHLVPFAIAFILFEIPYFITLSYYPQYFDKIFQLIAIIPVVGILSLVYYVYLCFKLLKHYRVLIKNNYSTLSPVDLHWISLLVKGMLIFLLLDALGAGLIIIYPDFEFVVFLNVFYLVGLIWYIGYFGIIQNDIFLTKNLALNNNERYPTLTTHNQRIFKLTNEKEIANLKNKLYVAFEKQQFFKEESITLNETARRIGTSDKKLSELINIELNSNFYEYVNLHRIDAFKKRIRNGDTKHLTLLAIAFESGFNSKATFNRIFKQYEGMTPSQFKNRVDKKLK